MSKSNTRLQESSNGSIIKLINLEKSYFIGEIVVPVLKNLNLNISNGEYVSIMGPSGSGKSTLMNILGCLDQPTSGHYLFNNHNVDGLDDVQLSKIRNEKIGFVFQNFSLLPRITAWENVQVPLIYKGLTRKVRQKKAIAILDKVGLKTRANHKPNELSGGQKQRVAIARALVNKPSIILADEPTGNLDSKTGREIMEIFDLLNREGNTIIIVTHEHEIADRTHRLIRLRDGRLLRDQLN